MIIPTTVRMEEVSGWLADDDKQHMIIQLLNKEVRIQAERLGLLQEPQSRKLYFPCEGEARTETWKPRYKSSSKLTVAQRIYAQQLGRFIWWHVAVTPRFTYLGDSLVLRLTPTIQLTADGQRAIFGAEEGTVITRLIYNRYNASYLNSLLFWISKLAGGKDHLSLAQGKVRVSVKPIESKIKVGIFADRPVAEPMQEIPEIQIEEG